MVQILRSKNPADQLNNVNFIKWYQIRHLRYLILANRAQEYGRNGGAPAGYFRGPGFDSCSFKTPFIPLRNEMVQGKMEPEEMYVASRHSH